jgi:hypothetical protein
MRIQVKGEAMKRYREVENDSIFQDPKFRYEDFAGHSWLGDQLRNLGLGKIADSGVGLDYLLMAWGNAGRRVDVYQTSDEAGMDDIWPVFTLEEVRRFSKFYLANRQWASNWIGPQHIPMGPNWDFKKGSPEWLYEIEDVLMPSLIEREGKELGYMKMLQRADRRQYRMWQSFQKVLEAMMVAFGLMPTFRVMVDTEHKSLKIVRAYPKWLLDNALMAWRIQQKKESA